MSMPFDRCANEKCRTHAYLIDGLCVRCKWWELRARALETDAEEDWRELDMLNQLIEESVG